MEQLNEQVHDAKAIFASELNMLLLCAATDPFATRALSSAPGRVIL